MLALRADLPIFMFFYANALNWYNAVLRGGTFVADAENIYVYNFLFRMFCVLLLS